MKIWSRVEIVTEKRQIEIVERVSQRRIDMQVYMVERSLPGINMEQLAAAQKAAIETSIRFTAEGKAVRYSGDGAFDLATNAD